MLTVEQGWVSSQAQGLRVLLPEESKGLKSTAHCVLVFHCGSQVETMLIRGKDQFQDLLFCMSMFGDYMVRCGDKGVPESECLDIGYARLTAMAEKGPAPRSHTLGLQIFHMRDELFEDGSKPVRSAVTNFFIRMSQAEIRAFGKIFAKARSCKVQPAFQVHTEEWFDLSSLTNPECAENRARADLIFKAGRRARA